MVKNQVGISKKLIFSLLFIVVVVFCLFPVILVGGILRNINQATDASEFTAYDYQPFPSDAHWLQILEGNAEIQLPSSAKDIYSYTTGFRDIFIMVRFSLSAQELDKFLENSLCNRPPVQIEASIQHQYPENPEWWKPHQANHLEECTGKKEHVHQQILIDMSDQFEYLVYVSTSTH